jgi:hypothetical protein
MDLPFELRNCVYEQVFVTYRWKHAPHNVPAPSVVARSLPTGNKLLVHSDLVCISKQVYREIMDVAWKYTWKFFPHTGEIMAFITSGSPPDYNSLRRVSLAFFNAYFLELLGMEDHGGDGFAAIQGPYAGISVLHTLPALVCLNFHSWRVTASTTTMKTRLPYGTRIRG